MPTPFRLAVSLLFAASFACAEVTPLAVGASVPPLAAKDQFDKPIAVEAQTQLLMFSNSMDANKLVTAAWSAADAKCQQSEAIRYFADIARMPSLIAKTFALPKMRERPFRIGLLWDSDMSAAIPRLDNQVTLLGLENGNIASIRFAADANTVTQALVGVCGIRQP